MVKREGKQDINSLLGIIFKMQWESEDLRMAAQTSFDRENLDISRGDKDWVGRLGKCDISKKSFVILMESFVILL